MNLKPWIAAVLFSISSPVFAQEAVGPVEEIRVCGTGSESTNQWIRTITFKVGGKWFGVYADHYSNSSYSSLDNNFVPSIVMMAFSQNLSVSVKATDDWGYHFSNCGLASVKVFHGNAGDYVSVVK